MGGPRLFRWHTYKARARRRLHGERGFALIEVVVSAALLVVVAGGVLAGIDGPEQVSGRNQARSTASTLAQQDQERLRAMTVSSLIGYTTTRTVAVAGTNWSVYSKVIWIRDANDTDSCTVAGDDTSGDYLKITSRAWTGNVTPVELNSLLTPPPGTIANTKGTLAVRITDQLDQPVVGQSVTIAGPDNLTVSTNAAGCAVFGLVEKGTYTITFSRSGWLDPSSVQNVSASTSVTAGSTTLVNKSYAQAGTIHAAIDTSVNGTLKSSAARALTISNGGIPAGTLTFNAANVNTGQSTFDLAVYPFPSGYGVWAGSCSAGNPTLYGQPPVIASPGPGATANVSVRQPAINLTLKRNNVLYASNHVRITSTDVGCNSVVTSSTTAAGVFQDPGFPYGHYGVCGDDATNHDSGAVVGTAPLGTAIALNIPIASGGGGGNGGNGNGNNGNGNGNGGGSVPAANQGTCP